MEKPEKIKRVRFKVWLMVLIDILLIGAGLNVFALFHHVLPEIGKVAVPAITPSPTPASTPQPLQSAEPAMESDTQFFFDGVFAQDGQSEKTENSYKSKNVSITLTTHDVDDLRYYVQDIYVRKIDYFKTAFAQDTFGTGIKEYPYDIAQEHDAICAISGDYYGARKKSVVIRNGVLYRSDTYDDICVIYNDGVMRVFDEDEFDAEKEMQNGAYQAWDFGPNLLNEDGTPIEKFNSRIASENPRTAIGYYEPGHYCFVVVDGRGANGSDGLSLKDLAQLFADLGCKAAYNLDGGRTSCMVMYGEMINKHYESNCRKSSDIVMICDEEQ